jgi:hypothetical protein
MASPERPRRERAHACIHPETYKYFFARDEVLRVWGALEREFGPIRYDATFRVMEIRSRELILRSTMSANPITVIRTRRCEAGTIGRLHDLMGYVEGDEGDERGGGRGDDDDDDEGRPSARGRRQPEGGEGERDAPGG